MHALNLASNDTGVARGERLRLNTHWYDSLTQVLADSTHLSADATLSYIQELASFATDNHPGRFADGALENVVLELGGRLERKAEEISATGKAAPKQGTRHILHVATWVFTVGGHTRTIKNWVEQDRESRHSLVLVDQGDEPIPAWLNESFLRAGGSITTLPPGSHLRKAAALRILAQHAVDLVVLHHGPHDVVPTLAFARSEGVPPVAVLNHADHIFWLGSSVADMIINLRSAGQRYNESRRFVANNVYLPIPLAPQPTERNRDAARSALGISADQLVFLSVGRGLKYRPTPKRDFFRACDRILSALPDARVYLVGVSREEAIRYAMGGLHPRLIPFGEVEDPSPFHAAADIYLEGFPFNSATALLEAALAGLSVVPAHSPPTDLIETNHDTLSGLIRSPQSEEEYVQEAVRLASDPIARQAFGTALQERVRHEHMGVGWLAHLRAVYERASRLTHRAAPIPPTAGRTEPVDVALSDWSADRLSGSAEKALRLAAWKVLFSAAYDARNFLDYKGARWLLCQGLVRGGNRWRTILALMKLAAHRIRSWCRNA